jgi:hypothetical protein
MTRVLTACLATAVLAGLAGCGQEDEPSSPSSERGLVVSTQSGSVAGVTLGDSGRVVERVFGPPLDREGYMPIDEPFTGPQSIAAPVGGGGSEPYRYREFAFLVSPGAGVYSLMTTRSGARTERGVAIGDELSAVQDAYPDADCGKYDYGEGARGYAWCRVRVGRNEVFFGGDPVASLTVTGRATARR